jgi:thiol-disulfide isomerase/thioredoxin
MRRLNLAATRRRAASLALALAALSLGSAGAGAQGGNGILGLQATGEYILLLGGKEQAKAEIYMGGRPAGILLISSQWASPVLIAQLSGRVETIDLMKVAKKPDGSVDLLPGAILGSEGTIRFEPSGDIAFRSQGKEATLRPRPHLLGNQTRQSLLDHDPAYRRRAEAFRPDAAVLADLRAALERRTQPVRVLVFFGSWCSHCAENLPKLLRVEGDLAGTSNVRFEYHGMSKTSFETDPEGRKYGIKFVPQGVVFVDGKEVGRLESGAWLRPESALRDLIAKL